MGITKSLLTQFGLEVIADAHGGGDIIITGLVVGDGYLPSDTPGILALTSLASEKARYTIDGHKVNGQEFTAWATINNVDVAEEFKAREFGLMAADPAYPNDRQQDKLYCVSGYEPSATDPAADWLVIVPPNNTTMGFQPEVHLSTYVSETASIIVYQAVVQGGIKGVNGIGPGLDGYVTLSAPDVGAAPTSHNHNASAITDGILPVERGGTGASNANRAFDAQCSTPSAQEIKAVSIPGYQPRSGDIVTVNLNEGNTAPITTTIGLQINDLEVMPIFFTPVMSLSLCMQMLKNDKLTLMVVAHGPPVSWDYACLVVGVYPTRLQHYSNIEGPIMTETLSTRMDVVFTGTKSDFVRMPTELASDASVQVRAWMAPGDSSDMPNLVREEVLAGDTLYIGRPGVSGWTKIAGTHVS